MLSDLSLEGDRLGTDLVTALADKPVYLMTSLPTTDPRHKQAVGSAPLLPKPFSQTDLAKFLGHEGKTP